MDQPPPLTLQRQRDEDHLNLLSTLHYVGAGLAVLGLGFLFVHFMLVSTVFTSPQMIQNMQQAQQRQAINGAPPMPFQPQQLVALFKVFYIFGAFWLVASLILNIASAMYLRARKNRGFSIFVGVFDCLHMPLGTILGIFTIVILSRDTVRQLYAEKAALAGGTY